MTLASSKQMADKKMKQIEIESTIVQDRNTSGVVIRVYEESERPRSRKLSQNSIAQPRAASSTKQGGYDRRAQLLAQSRQLRNHHAATASQNVALPTIHSQTKSKKGFWLTKPVRIRYCSPSRYMPLRFISSGCTRYEPQVESGQSKERKRSKDRRKSVQKACHPFLSKMKKMLKELSCKEI